jgi:16S rRNA processing protein RimM
MQSEVIRSQDCKDSDLVVVGKITGHHGLKGWVKVLSFTRPMEQLFDYKQVLHCDEKLHSRMPCAIAAFRKQGKGLIANIKGASSREESDFLIGRSIAIQKSQLQKLDSGEYYWIDIIGSRVVRSSGLDVSPFEFGEVSSMMETGANDVMVVKSLEENAEERLIPWIPDVVKNFDLINKLIEVDWDEDF